jgi:hypothetical protein
MAIPIIYLQLVFHVVLLLGEGLGWLIPLPNFVALGSFDFEDFQVDISQHSSLGTQLRLSSRCKPERKMLTFILKVCPAGASLRLPKTDDPHTGQNLPRYRIRCCSSGDIPVEGW